MAQPEATTSCCSEGNEVVDPYSSSYAMVPITRSNSMGLGPKHDVFLGFRWFSSPIFILYLDPLPRAPSGSIVCTPAPERVYSIPTLGSKYGL